MKVWDMLPPCSIIEVTGKLERAGVSCIAAESFASVYQKNFIVVQTLGANDGYYHFGTNCEPNFLLHASCSKHSAS